MLFDSLAKKKSTFRGYDGRGTLGAVFAELICQTQTSWLLPLCSLILTGNKHRLQLALRACCSAGYSKKQDTAGECV